MVSPSAFLRPIWPPEIYFCKFRFFFFLFSFCSSSASNRVGLKNKVTLNLAGSPSFLAELSRWAVSTTVFPSQKFEETEEPELTVPAKTRVAWRCSSGRERPRYSPRLVRLPVSSESKRPNAIIGRERQRRSGPGLLKCTEQEAESSVAPT